MWFVWFCSFLILNCWYFTMDLDIPWGEWSPCDRSCKTESEPGIRFPGTTYFCHQCQTVSLAPGQTLRSKIIVKKLKWRKRGMTWEKRKKSISLIHLQLDICHVPGKRFRTIVVIHSVISRGLRAHHFTDAPHSALRKPEMNWGRRAPWTRRFELSSDHLHRFSHRISTLSPQFFSIILNSSQEDLLKILTSLHRS